VSEAERRASAADKRAADAKAQAELTRREAEEQAHDTVSQAREEADDIVAKAQVKAEKILAEAELTAIDRREAIQRELEELTRQRDGVAEHVAKMRAVFGA
jgi:vacuolar-type H+-ATPase subunit H